MNLRICSTLSVIAAGSVWAFAPSVDAQTTPAAESAPASASTDAVAPAAQPKSTPAVFETTPSLRFELNSWIWLQGIEGTVGARGQKADINASFADIVDASDSIFAFSGRLEVGYGKFGIYLDGFYADLGADDLSGPLGLASIDLTFQQSILDFGAMYRLGEWEPTGDAALSNRNTTLDLYAGGRYSGLELELDPRNLPSRSAREEWVDPVVGLKLTLPFSEKWYAKINGDVGGFGVASDFTWSATGVVGYDFHLFSVPATVMVGYRAIGWDYSDGSGNREFTWDVIVHGPMIGLGFRF